MNWLCNSHSADAPPPKKTIFKYHPPYPPSSQLSAKLATNPSERLEKYPDMPSIWAQQQGLPNLSIQQVMGQEIFDIICAGLYSDQAAADNEKLYEEKLVAKWLSTVCSDKQWEIKYNCEVKIVEDLLQSYFVGTKYRPDIWFSSIHPDNFPLNYAEVLSNGNLDITVGELERTLIDQLRLYRNFNTNCTEVHGYILPASVTKIDIPEHGLTIPKKRMLEKKRRAQEKRRCPLLCVTVCWHENYIFSSNLQHIANPFDLIQGIKANAQKNHEEWVKFFSIENLSFPFFLPVSPSHISERFGSGAFQVPSGKSIVIASSSKIYKLIVSSKVTTKLQEVLDAFQEETEERVDIADFISIPSRILFKGIFFVSNKLIFPLKRYEAKKCLDDFIDRSWHSVQSLHECNYVHLDIRLENICFRLKENNLKAILIDLESLSKSSAVPYTPSCNSAMGIMPAADKWDSTTLDWKQFGMMVAYILEEKEMTHEEYHDKEYEYEVLKNSSNPYYDFVSKLVNFTGESNPAILRPCVHCNIHYTCVIAAHESYNTKDYMSHACGPSGSSRN